MTDVHTKEQRSRNMAAIRSRDNKSTERAFLKILKSGKVTGWRRHYKKIKGTPDFAFPTQKLAVFADGCFWHGCLVCKLNPQTNKSFWANKIKLNKKRDKTVNKELKQKSWTVLRFWEHQIKNNPGGILCKIQKEFLK